MADNGDNDEENGSKPEPVIKDRALKATTDVTNETYAQGNTFTKIRMITGKFGSYMSLFLLLAGMIASIIAQNYAESHLQSSRWTEGCPSGYDDSCTGNGAVYRFSFALVLIFACQFIGTSIYVKYYDEYWFGKLLTYVGIVIGFYYVRASVFDERGYAWFARIVGFFYVILQQVILIDFAYEANSSLLAFYEEGKEIKWLAIILTSAIILFSGSIAAIGVMYWQFQGCASTNTIISLTLILPILATLVQIFVSDNGSVLTSGMMMAYSTYVCYSSVTLNPDTSCNPTISTSYQTVSTAIGLGLTVLSITWTAYNTVKKVQEVSGKNPESEAVDVSDLRTLLQQVSVVFILVSGEFYARILSLCHLRRLQVTMPWY